MRVSRKADASDGDVEAETVHTGRVISLKSFKKEVASVRRGQECGVILADFSETQEGDILTFFEMVPRRPSIYEEIVEPPDNAANAS